MLMWLVQVRAPVHCEWGEMKRCSCTRFTHRLDNVNNPVMTEAINGQQRGCVFRLDHTPFYKKADVQSGHHPIILNLEWVSSVLEVVV